MNRTEQRLQRAVQARLEPDEHLVAWTPAWVSRYRRFHVLLSLRNRDFAVVTNRRLMLWSTGFFTRRPKRRVLSDRLDELTIESTSRDPGRVMACSRPGRPALLLELGKDARSDRFSIELRDRSLAAKAAQRRATADAERVYSPHREEPPTPYEFGLFMAPPADDEPAPEPEPGAEANEQPAAEPAAEEKAEPEAEAEVEPEVAEPAAAVEPDGEAAAEAEQQAPATDEAPTDTDPSPSDLRSWP
jgi:hypothetical protein